MTQFKKGQIVYQAQTNFSQDAQCNTTMAVIERKVDSCGKKVMTFEDRCGNDVVFGRSVSVRVHDGRVFHNIHATPAEAFAALHAHAIDTNTQRAARPDVYKGPVAFSLITDVQSDADADLFTKLKAGQLATVKVA